MLTSTNFNTHIRDNLIHYGGSDAISSSPPASPGNGQRWIYPADAANAVYWHFAYISALAVWACVGGSPLNSQVEGQVSTSVVTFSDLGPTLTLPRAGVYDVTYGAQVSTAGVIALILAGADSGAARPTQGAGGGTFDGESRTFRLTAAAGNVLKTQYAAFVGGSATTMQGRFLQAKPVYVT